MPSEEEIKAQQELLTAYRRTLTQYLKQRAMLSELLAPPSIAHGIQEARDHIRHIKKTLHSWGVTIEDHPDDEEPSSTQPVPTSRKVPASRRIGVYIGAVMLLISLAIVGLLVLMNIGPVSPAAAPTANPLQATPTLISSAIAPYSPMPAALVAATAVLPTAVPPTAIPPPPTSTIIPQTQSDKPNWIVTFQYRFAPEFWSIGTHEYTINADCPNIKDANGSWTNTFQVSEDASLLPGNLYLRFAGVKKQPVGAAPSIEKIHPAQSTIALFGYAGITRAEAEQISRDCMVTVSWDGGTKQLMGAQTPYYEEP